MIVAIVLVNYNGLTDTIECLESLRIFSGMARILVVDNGSVNKDAQVIANLNPDIEVLHSQQNTGWSGGNNIGIHRAFYPQCPIPYESVTLVGGTVQVAPADLVLLLNNDTEVAPELLDELIYAFRLGYDVVGPVINEYHDRGAIQTEGTLFNLKDDSAFFFAISAPKTDKGPSAIVDVDIVNGCAVAFTKKVFDTIGPIDDRFFLICEESDYCLRAKEAGFRCGVIGKSLVYHKHSVSFKKSGKPLQRYYAARNLWLLLKKHRYGHGRKSRIQSTVTYFRHMYHLICFELEHSNQKSAEAIVHGMADAFMGRYGKMSAKDSLLRQVAFRAIDSLWRLRGGIPLASGTKHD